MFKHLKHDIPAGLVVFLVALPLCLGIALASGAPLYSGLIAGIIGGIVVGGISGSQVGASGPAAGLTIIVLGAIQTLGFDTFLLAVIFSGILQIIFGLLRGGIIAYYFPLSVIKGMLASIGLILILKQIPHAFGYDKEPEGGLEFFQMDGENTFSELINSLNYIHPGAIIICLVGLAILLIWDRYVKSDKGILSIIPGALVVVVVGILLNKLFYAIDPILFLDSTHLVNVPVPKNLNDFASNFTIPDFSAFNRTEVYISGFTLAVVGSLETLLCVEATDKLDPERRITPTNRELIAQGVGNTFSGLIGGLPITQVIVRSSVNIDAGSKSKASTIVHGFLLLFSVIFISEYLNWIPLSALASILFVVGYKLTRPKIYKEAFKLGYDQFMPFIITIVAVLFTDLLIGIGVGLAASIFYILRTNYRTNYICVKDQLESGHHHYTVELSEEISFLNKGSLQLTLSGFEAHSVVTIDGEKAKFVPYDIKEIIRDFILNSKRKDIKVEIKNIDI